MSRRENDKSKEMLMALGKCKECQNVVSSEAKACPHCGARKPVIPEKSPTRWGFILAAMVAIGLIGKLATTQDPVATPAPPISNVRADSCSQDPFLALPVGTAMESTQLSVLLDDVCPRAIYNRDETISLVWKGRPITLRTTKLPYDGIAARYSIDSLVADSP